MSSLRNIKNHVQAVRQNGGILTTDQVQLVSRTTAPTDSNLANGRLYYDSVLAGLYAYINSAWVNLGTGGAAGITSWDGLYDNDKTLEIDSTTLTFAGTAALGANNLLTITNAGSGKDIVGPAWSIISTGSVGILELTSGGTINATDGALTIGKTATATTFAGTVTMSEAVTATTSITITGTADTTCLTVTAGDVSIANGKVVQVNDDTDTAYALTADSVTTGIVFDINADGLTNGTILHLDSNVAGWGTGLFLDCYDGAASAFSVGIYGTTTIAGNAATNVFLITAGDVVWSDASLTMTDADDAATLSITNNTNVGTNASLIAVAGSGAYTGSTTKSFVSITPSGLTTGTAFYLPVAAITTGKGLHIAGATSLTQGSLLYVQDTGAACAITSGTIATFDETATTANANRTGKTVYVSSARTVTAGAAADDFDNVLIARAATINGAGSFSEAGAVLNLTNTVTNTSGTITDTTNGLEITMSVNGTGSGITVTHSATGGKAVNVSSASTTVSDVLVTGTGAKADNKACIEATNNGATAAGGSILRITNTGTPAAATSYLVDFDYGGATMTNNPTTVYINAKDSTNDGVQVNGSGAIASGKGLLAVLPTGNIAAGGAGLSVISGASTPAAATSYLVNFSYASATMTNNPITMLVNSGSSTAAGIKITGSGAPATGNLQIASTATGALGAVINLDQTANSAANSDVIGEILFTAQDNANAAETYGKIDCVIRDVTAADPDASMVFYVDKAGTNTQHLALGWDTVNGATLAGILVGTGAATAIVSSQGAYDLVLETNGGTSSGTITITDAANGDITIAPNGTGQTLLYAPTWTVTSKAAGTTLTVAEGGVILANTGVGGITLVLPAAATSSGLWYTFKKTNADATALTIDANGAELIDGAATYALCDAQYDTVTIVCDGTGWHIISKIIA